MSACYFSTRTRTHGPEGFAVSPPAVVVRGVVVCDPWEREDQPTPSLFRVCRASDYFVRPALPSNVTPLLPRRRWITVPLNYGYELLRGAPGVLFACRPRRFARRRWVKHFYDRETLGGTHHLLRSMICGAMRRRLRVCSFAAAAAAAASSVAGAGSSSALFGPLLVAVLLHRRRRRRSWSHHPHSHYRQGVRSACA
jgi:hypothetical protein